MNSIAKYLSVSYCAVRLYSESSSFNIYTITYIENSILFLLDTKIKRAQVFYIGERTNLMEIIKVVDRVRLENTIINVDEHDDQAGINTLLLQGRVILEKWVAKSSIQDGGDI